MIATLLLLAAVAPDAAHTCGTPGPLEVRGEVVASRVGEATILWLHASRPQARVSWDWRVVEAPANSRATVLEPRGRSDLGRGPWWDPCLRVYFDGEVPRFSPDVPGHYAFEARVVEVTTGELAFARTELFVSPALTGTGPGTGCTSAGAWPAPVVAALLWARRRRRPRA